MSHGTYNRRDRAPPPRQAHVATADDPLRRLLSSADCAPSSKNRPPACRRRAALGPSGLWGALHLRALGLTLLTSALVRRLVGRAGRRLVAVLGHEGVELFLVLGVAEAAQGGLELLLLLFEAA